MIWLLVTSLFRLRVLEDEVTSLSLNKPNQFKEFEKKKTAKMC